MKLPKIIKILDKEWKIKKRKDLIGAAFTFSNSEITLGIREPKKIQQSLFHELLEICAVELHLRYTDVCETEDYLFSFKHKDFTLLNQLFYSVLINNNLIKRIVYE